jgi:Fur family peroxide stress response transcriptional regulator
MVFSRDIEAGLSNLRERARDLGLALTPQRIAIYGALLESRDHPSPEAVYDRVKPRLPGVSLATIYKTLDTLVQLGVAAEVPAQGATKRYDANMERHHHLVCERCNEIEDFYDEAMSPRLPRTKNGFVARSVSCYVYGLCDRCARLQSAKKG